jgi:hypothetical protein
VAESDAPGPAARSRPGPAAAVRTEIRPMNLDPPRLQPGRIHARGANAVEEAIFGDRPGSAPTSPVKGAFDTADQLVGTPQVRPRPADNLPAERSQGVFTDFLGEDDVSGRLSGL